jgi:hypothetical protein
VTASQLASHVDGDERYLREWLEQQAMAELLTCSNDSRPGGPEALRAARWGT